ncbi:type VI secretion system-associated protein TagF [Psychromonas sp.]|uniref:type VI secretion system-associated protein TagF n=1 Tax=Psychromonas sp. TaxID=1884585 RepID=UPI0039E6BFF7
MNNEIPLGLYGKLPGYGDFIHRNLPAKFLTAWDDWLQLFIAGSKEQMGDNWLDIYLTSPIWRFVLSAGVVDENHWAGIVLPSVDQVGRYYPFSIAIPLPGDINPLEFISVNARWYQHIEELALQALEGEFSIEELLAQANHQQLMVPMAYRKTGQQAKAASLKIDFQFEEELPSNAYAHLLDSLLTATINSYSAWSTSGSENLSPCLFTVQGLPPASQIPAMMDGQWARWGWPQAYDQANL